MNRFLLFLLSLAALAIPTTSWAATSTSSNLAINITGTTPTTGVESPGPSLALFNSPYYTCVRNFYVATNGSDSNSGTSASSPWQTIAHADTSSRTGGDCINVAPGSYSAFNRGISHGGTTASSTGYVTYRCTAPGFTAGNPSGGCVITDGGKSVCSGSGAGCGTAYPSYLIFDGFSFLAPAQNTFATAFTCYNGDVGPSSPGCHHWVIINNVVSGYGQGGVQGNDTEYWFTIHNLIYNNSYASGCDGGAQGSGISYAASLPVAGYTQTADDIGPTPQLGIYGDTGNRFHQYIEWNVVYNNRVAGCSPATDGNGIILDTNDNSNTGVNYAGGFLVAFNISYNNGGSGFHAISTRNATWANNSCFNNYLDITNNGSERACIDVDDDGDLIINNISVAPMFAGTCSFPGVPPTVWNNPMISNSYNNPITWNNNISYEIGGNSCGRADYQGNNTYSCSSNKCQTHPL